MMKKMRQRLKVLPTKSHLITRNRAERLSFVVMALGKSSCYLELGLRRNFSDPFDELDCESEGDFLSSERFDV